MKRLFKLIYKCFKKVRINASHDDPLIDKLYEKRRKLLMNENENIKNIKKLKKVEKLLGHLLAEKNVKIIKQETKGINCEIGGVNSNKLWQLKKKLCKKATDPPSAMINSEGDLITSNSDIKKEALKTFSTHLERNPINESYKHLETTNKKLFEEKLKLANFPLINRTF